MAKRFKALAMAALLLMTIVTAPGVAVATNAVDVVTSATTWTETETPTKATTDVNVAPVATEGQVTYTVKSGDLFWKIAKDNGLTTAELVALNPQVKNANMIYVGDVIVIKAGTAVAAPAQTASEGQKYYLGLGMISNYRLRGGEKDNLNVTSASAVFDSEGKIVDIQWDVMEVTTSMFQWMDNTIEKPLLDEAVEAVLEWESKREEGYAYDMTHLLSKGAADNLTKNEWFVQLDYFEEYFKGMTVDEVVAWFNKYTDANGRPYKVAYPEKLTESDLATTATFTAEELAMLVDVTTSATMSLQDGHSYFIDSLVEAWNMKEEIK
ncbi:MAG: LysM domain-containing protein [Clostridiales bacterium]|jgi:LysM repeat protein|nr:LysM domain-containing protein [Clostridiales bacterium]